VQNPLIRAAAALGLVVRTGDGDPAPFAPDVRPPRRDVDPPLSLDSVFRAVLLLQTAASQLTLDVWRGDELIPRPALVDNPDVFSHRPAFLAETTGSMAQRGEAFWKHYLDPSGRVTGLKVLDPLKVEPLPDGWFSIDGVRQFGGVSHLQLMRRPGKLHGLGPIQACASTVTGAIELRRWADNWLDQGQVPNGQLTSDQQINEATAARYKASFVEKQSFRNGPIVLGSGLRYSPLLLKPEEMQWLEAQDFNVVAVARMFGIPTRHMLASPSGDSQTYANLEQDEISFVRFTMMRYFNEIEAAFTSLLPRGQVARINLDGLLRTDTKTRYEAHKIGIDAGFLDPDEVRAIEHLPARKPA
jgi:HK97 family phage portal protein